MPAQFRQRISMAAFGRNVHGVDNCFARERLSQQRDDTKIEGTANVLGVGEAGHEDHLGRERAAKRRADSEAVRRRHDQIQENDIGIVDRRGIERLAARGGRDDRVPLFLEPHSEEASQLI
jgi:hypothetical protein